MKKMAATEIEINSQDYFYSSPPFELFDFWAVVDVQYNESVRRAEKILKVQMGLKDDSSNSKLDEFVQSIELEVRTVGEIDSLLDELFQRGASSVRLVGVPSGFSGGGI